MLKVERELELRVIYAIGDASGALANEVRLGVSSLRAYPDVLKAAQTWRSEPIREHFAHVIRGAAMASHLRSNVETMLRSSGVHKRASWWLVDGATVEDAVVSAAESSGVRLLTRTEAAGLEMERMHEIMTDVLG